MRSMRWVAFALVLGGAAAPRSGRALDATLAGQPLRLDFTESLYLNWHGDPGNGDPSSADYYEALSRLNAQAAWREWLFGLRLDSSGYLGTPELGEQLARPGAPTQVRTVRENDLRDRFQQHPWDPTKVVEKVSLSYQGRAVEATLGDFYANFGRGLVLSIRKVDELGQDTTLFGGKVTVRKGVFTGTALAGATNIQNLDEATAKYTEDPWDKIAAARAEVRLFDKVNVGAHGMLGLPSKNSSLLSEQDDRYARAGVTIDARRPVDWLALYGEYAHREDRLVDSTVAGNALYGAATVFAGKTSWLFEGKAYDNYDVWHASNDPFNSIVYMQPPTLERVTTQLSDNADIVAGRLRTDVNVAPGAVIFASAEYGRIHPTDLLDHDLYDAYAGTQLRWGDGDGHVFPLVAYRLEQDRLNKNELVESLYAFEGDAAQRLNSQFSLEAQWQVWRREKFAQDPWLEGQAYLALKSAPKFVVAAGYEFTTLDREQANTHHFLNGTAQWNITPSTSLRVFAGGQRPGLKCISGLCRVFPAFNGAKLELVVRQ